jgi:iron(III) transport system permease protein
VFRTVTWPLLRPALADAFLLGFVESLADFGNPIVLAGNFECCRPRSSSPSRARSTIRAAPRCSRWCCSADARRVLAAAALAGRSSYVTVSGKGDGGAAGAAAARCGSRASASPRVWIVFTLVCYAVILDRRLRAATSAAAT